MTSKQLTEIKLGKEDKFVENSRKFQITSGKKYTISTRVKGSKGEQFCGYFGAVILDKKGIEIARRISWLNDWSGTNKAIEITFVSPPKSSDVILIYRINHEVPVKSNCHFHVLPIDKITIEKAANKSKENYLEPADYALPRLKELSKEEELTLEKNLVWIFASPRSGTSWLGTQLLSYQTIPLNEIQLGVLLGMREPTIKHKIVRRLEIFKKEPDFFFSDQYRDTWNFYLRKLLLNRIFAQVHTVTKKVIIKEPSGTMGSDIIAQCVPKSKIIFMIRDGRDVLDSKIDQFQKDSWSVKQYNVTPLSQKNRPVDIKYQAQLWVKLLEVITKTFDEHPKELRLLVKYESLLNNTLEELQKIYNFIGIKIPKTELDNIVNIYSFKNIPREEKGKGKVTRSATPGMWKKNFSDKEKKIIDEIMNETLKKFGY